MSSKRVYWIEGDGIGPEIWRAARPVIDAALAKESDMRIEWVELLAGEKATAETGSPLPEETMNALRTADFAMKGPLGTPVGRRWTCTPASVPCVTSKAWKRRSSIPSA